MAARGLQARSGVGAWVVSGGVTGMVAGIVFAIFEMVVAALMDQGFFMPLRMIAAIVLGEEALDPSYALVTAALVGLAVHMALSALFGMVLAGGAGSVGALRESRFGLIAAATLFGLVLWLVNFFLIAPVLFPWFEMADQVVQFVAHTFFYGMPLGILLASIRSPGVEATRVPRTA